MLTFGRSSAVDVLQELKAKALALERDPLNAELANSCAIDAWSLCDWAFKEYGATLSYAKLSDFQVAMKKRCSALELLQDVANETKHAQVTKYVPKLKEARENPGTFDPSFFSADFFDVSALVLVHSDGSVTSFITALSEVVEAWEDFFRDHRIVSL